MPLPFPDPAGDVRACSALLRGGSRSFHAAARLLPRPVREAAVALYAFCRLADDAVDLGGDPSAALSALRARLAEAAAGQPRAIPADRALAAVLRRFAIPPALPEALLEGFAWDAERRRYADLEALHAYAMRVAGSVGMMMALLMGVRAPAALARAADLGVAMQLTNIARDVGEDARAGRLYLPLDWMAAAGIDAAAFLDAPAHSPALAGVIARLLDEAEMLYARGGAGIALLPPACRPGIGAARHLYAAIGGEIRRAGFDAVTARAVVAKRRRLALLARGIGALVPPRRSGGVSLRTLPALPAARPLLHAVAATTVPGGKRGARVPGRVEERAVWLLDLFERLELRDQRDRRERLQRLRA
ncbi:MAG: phytoene/squalene synthase family protein [Acetobacteraceae bacterium]